MKTITRLGFIAAAFTMLSMLAPNAPAGERANKYFKVSGKVIQIDTKDRTLLVTDRLSKKLYLIEVPELVTFKITFGRCMKLAQPGFEDVRIGERVEIRCISSTADHLSRIDGGQLVTTLIAAR